MPRVQTSDSEKAFNSATSFSIRAFYPIRRRFDPPAQAAAVDGGPGHRFAAMLYPAPMLALPPLTVRFPLVRFFSLGMLSFALSGCTAWSRLTAALEPAASAAPPTQIRFDPYPAQAEPAYRAIAEAKGSADTASAAASVALTDGAMLEHLRLINARYAGRRMPALAWTALVKRHPPGRSQADAPQPVYWDVALVSSKVRGGSFHYECVLRVSAAGVNLSQGRSPTELCRWQEQTGQDFSTPDDY
jgi:hypothetical protein